LVKKFLIISIFFLLPFFSYAQKVNGIDFTDASKSILKNLSTTTKQKLKTLTELIKSQNFANTQKQSLQDANNKNISPEVCYPSSSNYNQQACKKLQQQIQNTPNQFATPPFAPQQPQFPPPMPTSAPQLMPDNQAPTTQQGNQPPEKKNDADANNPVSDGGECSDFGVKITGGSCGYGPNDMDPKLKLAFRNLCRLNKQKMNITNSRRESKCSGKNEAWHSGGRAFDSEFTPFNDKDKTIMALYFMAHGFNGIGGYGPSGKGNGAPHFDVRPNTQRWGPGGKGATCARNNYPPFVVKAFDEVGVQPCDVSISPSAMKEKAQAALRRLGKPEYAD
jgi:hypothetical protein